MLSGSAFQVEGPACENARSPVTFVYCVKMSNRILQNFSPPGTSHTVLVLFPYQTLWKYT